MNTPGIKIVIGDADTLVSLYFKDNKFHQEVVSISENLYKIGATVIFPNTAIAEAVTTLQRKLSNPSAAKLLVAEYKQGGFEVEYIGEEIMKLASDIFNPDGSKKNTFFDAVVAACAKKLNADVVFSFDTWYKKQGFKLVSELF